MSNPFDDVDATFLVLTNDERQHSLWPDFLAVPAGWRTVHGPSTKADCLGFVEDHWLDMQPASLDEVCLAGDTDRDRVH